MNELTLFQFETNEIRTITDEHGEPWFVAKDVARALGYNDPTTAVRSHCKGVQKLHPLTTSGGTQNIRIISEPDVLRLIIGSTLPSAQKFERWVFEEVLPQIRKTDNYSSQPVSLAQQALLSAQAIVDHEKRLTSVETKVDGAIGILQQIETASDYFTVIGWFRYTKNTRDITLAEASKIGMKATKFCKDHNIKMGSVPDPRYGTVNTYPKWVLGQLVL